MDKCICDICKKKEADRKFKVKKEVDSLILDKRYVRIDLCGDCYTKLLLLTE